jgi:hypothetical protein
MEAVCWLHNRRFTQRLFTLDEGPGDRAVGSLTCAPTIPLGKLRSICDPQQILPLSKVALKAHAF